MGAYLKKSYINLHKSLHLVFSVSNQHFFRKKTCLTLPVGPNDFLFTSFFGLDGIFHGLAALLDIEF